MPHIRVRGAAKATIAKLSTATVKLAQIIGTTPDNFTFEQLPTQFFEDGKPVNGYPFIEVLWFSRSQDMKRDLAQFLTDFVKEIEPHPYITVIFRDLDAKSYFENGEHF